MRKHARTTIAGALVATLAAVALGGEPRRLAIELPPDVTALQPGEHLDLVQVVGVDADGARVGLGDRTPTLTATAGRITSVEPPYRFAYTAPAQIDGPLAVTLEARLPDDPAIRGTLRIDVLPPGPYVRLRLEATRERVGWGEETEITVRGEQRDGRLVPVADRRIEVELEGPGMLTRVRLGVYRLTAPAAPSADGETETTVRARVARDAAVHGQLRVPLGVPVPRRPPSPTRTAPHAEDEPATEAATDPEAEPARKDVLWPGERLRLTAWRVRNPPEDTSWRRLRRLPEPGAELVTRASVQRLRLLAEDATIRGVSGTARIGGEDGDPADDAVDVRSKRHKTGVLVVIVDAQPPADGRPLHVTLELTRAEGEPSRDVFVLRRKVKDDE